MTQTTKSVIAFIATLIVLACFLFIFSGSITNRESALISLVMTIMSVFATWLLTDIYADSQHRKAIEEVTNFHRTNLRTYAIKASEKVNNLSNELTKLSVYLREELDSTEYDNQEKSLLSREERIVSAIHLIGTLKSVNDTSLSDWQGVISDVLEKRREEKEEKEEEMQNIIERLETLWETQLNRSESMEHNKTALETEISSIRRDLRYLTSSLDLGSTRSMKPRRPPTPPAPSVKKECPACGTLIQYEQKAKRSSVKILTCPYCKAELIATYNTTHGYVLDIKGLRTETFNCPVCNEKGSVELDTLRGAQVCTQCSHCDVPLRFVRAAEKIRVSLISPSGVESIPTIDKGESFDFTEVLDKVKKALPPQPWPKGVHSIVAEELGISKATVYRAITKLIIDGTFMPQIEGKLYIPAQIETEK